MKGSYTVEAVFVMTISLWILLAILYSGMYLHDRIVLATITNERTALWLDHVDTISEKKWKKDMTEILDKQLFLIRVNEISQKKGVNCRRVKVRYNLPISWAFLRNILSGGKAQSIYKTTREDIRAVRYMWDMDIIKD